MGARIGQEISLALETEPERRCDDCVAHNRHVMQGFVEAQGESNDQKGVPASTASAGLCR